MRRILILLGGLAVLFIVECMCGSLMSAGQQVVLWATDSVHIVFLALGAGLVIACGQIDISTGALASLLGMILLATSNIAFPGLAGIYLIVGILVFGMLIQGVVGWLIVKKGFNALTCTLGCAFLYQGVASVIHAYVKGVGIFSARGDAMETQSTIINLEKYPSLLQSEGFWSVVAAAVCVGLLFWRYRTRWGLQHVAVGMNPESARYVGIPQGRIVVGAFVGAGFFVGLGTFAHMVGFSGGSWDPTEGGSWLLIAIGAAVLGGCTISGGHFEPIGIVVASVFMKALEKVILGLKLPSELQYVVFGVALVIFLAVENRRPRGRSSLAAGWRDRGSGQA